MEKEILISPTNKNVCLWKILEVYKTLKQTKLYEDLNQSEKKDLENLYMSLWWKLEIINIIPDNINELILDLYNEWAELKNNYIKQGLKYEDYAHNFGGIHVELLAWIDLYFFETKAFFDILANFSSFFIPFKSRNKKIREYFTKQINYLKQNKNLLPGYSDYLSKSVVWYESLNKHRTNIAHFLCYDLKIIAEETEKIETLTFYVQNNKYNLSKYKKDVNKELNLIRNGFVDFIEFYKNYFVDYLSKIEQCEKIKSE